MAGGHVTNSVFISDLLPRRHPRVADALVAIFGQRLCLIPGTKDIWCRDYMPVQLGPGRFVQFRYAPDYLRRYPKERTDRAADLLGMEGCRWSDLVIDGGNIIRHGRTAIVTSKVYRENRHVSRPALRERLRQELEVERLIVIPPEQDDVLGHADGVLRFVDQRTLLVNDYRQVDADYGQRLYRILRRYGFELIPFPYAPTDEIGPVGIPSAVGVYINFLQTDDVIVCPAFGLSQDGEVQRLLEEWFPKRRVLSLRCEKLAAKGGVINCVTWNRAG